MSDTTPPKLNLDTAMSGEEAKQNRTSLYGWLAKMQDILSQNPGACLVSRRDSDQLWRQTGFLVEDGIVYAKLGENHYQPIGKDDGAGFFPTQSSKLLWAHDFCIALMTPFKSAFAVEKIQKLLNEDPTDPNTLTEKERAMLEANFKDLETLYKTFEAATEEGDSNKIKAAESDVLDGLRLACIQCPKLDKKLTEFSIKNPELELKPDLTGKITPLQLFGIATEWIRLKLNDDGAKRHFEGTKLIADPSMTEAELAVLSVKKLEFCLAQLDSTPDMDLFKYVLEQSMAIFPELRAQMQEFNNTTDLVGAAKKALEFMKVVADNLNTPMAIKDEDPMQAPGPNPAP